jgi:hypothetical protein
MTVDPDDDPFAALRLTRDEIARLIAEVVEHRDDGMTRDEIETAVGVLVADYDTMVASRALWDAWRSRWVEFGVTPEGEMVCRPGPIDPDRPWSRPDLTRREAP